MLHTDGAVRPQNSSIFVFSLLFKATEPEFGKTEFALDEPTFSANEACRLFAEDSLYPSQSFSSLTQAEMAL